MDRGKAADVLRAYRAIDREIKIKQTFADELRGESGESKYICEIGELKATKEEILLCLDALPYVQRDAVWRHYVLNEQWERVRRKHSYSDSRIRWIASEGLDALGKAFESYPHICSFAASLSGSDTSI